MPGFDLKQVSRNDQGVLAAGALVFIFSFLPYWGWSAGPYSASTNAWTGYAIFGLLLSFVATGIVAARVFGNMKLPALPVGVNLLVAGLAALGTLLVILRGFTYPHASVSGFGVHESVGVKWGGYLVMLVAIAQTVFAVLTFRSSGEKIAWDSSAMSKPAQPGDASAQVPPAAPPQAAPPAYQPPPAAPTYQPPPPQPGQGDPTPPSV